MDNSISKDGVELWQDEAKCRIEDADTGEFFQRATEKEAKRFCNTCPVKGDCLEYALVYDMYGVWGGTTYNERKRKYPQNHRSILREDLKDSGLYNGRLKV